MHRAGAPSRHGRVIGAVHSESGISARAYAERPSHGNAAREMTSSVASAEDPATSDTRILILYPKNGYEARFLYACIFMDRSGPRIRANRKEQKALLCLLRDIRTEAGLRQQDIAEALRMPQSVVSKYESGERRLDIL